MKLLIILGVLFATPAFAQENSKWPTVVFTAAAVADGVTTYHFLTDDSLRRERNPVVSWMGRRPLAILATGATIEITSVWLWNKYVGKKYPKLAKWGLIVGAVVHTTYAIVNVHHTLTRCQHHPDRYGCAPK